MSSTGTRRASVSVEDFRTMVLARKDDFLDLIDLVSLKLNDEAAYHVIELHLKELKKHLQNLGVIE
jgi:hypothetical protein